MKPAVHTRDPVSQVQVQCGNDPHVSGAGEYMIKRYGDYLRLHIATHPNGAHKARAVTRNDMRKWVK